MGGKLKRDYRYPATILIFAALPLAACLIMCLREGVSPSSISLADSTWNDEVFYYKMVEAVKAYGEPLGYFGYNGSSAQAGRLGPWSPVLFVFYFGYARLFGWSMTSPVCCNILLMSAAMAVFAGLARPNVRQTCFICLLYASCSIITRYLFSCMAESSVYALLIVFLGVSARVRRQGASKGGMWGIAALSGIAFILTLMRPYWILLFMVPGYYWYRRNKRKAAVLAEALLAFVCLAVYFFITNRYCAAYVGSIIKLDWLELLLSAPGYGVRNIIHIFFTSARDYFRIVGEGLRQDVPEGNVYAVFLLETVFLGVMAFGRSGDKQDRLRGRYLLFCFCAMLLALFYLYYVRGGSRHILCFTLIFIFVYSMTEVSRVRYALFLAVFAWFLWVRVSDETVYRLPVYTQEKAAALSAGREALEEAAAADPRGSNPWDNTVIWLYQDGEVIDFTYLYALPEGMGINLCFKDYVLDNFDSLEPRYILTNVGGEVDLLCGQRDRTLIAEYGSVHIWRLR